MDCHSFHTNLRSFSDLFLQVAWNAYSIADFIIPKDESKGSYSGSDSRNSLTDEFSYAKLIDLGSLRGDYGEKYINISGYIKVYYSMAADNSQHAFVFSDSVVNNSGGPAGTYGDTGSVSHAVLFNVDNRSDFNFPESPMTGWYPNVAKDSSNGGSGGSIIFPLPDQGSGPAPTPIPATLLLFGSGLAFLWILRRASKS